MSEKTKSANQKPRSGDAARTRIEDDELGRSTFAQKLARTMALTPAADEAQVIALFGDWGCGKTTLKHFTAHFLREEHGIHPIEFSPWEWSGRDKLIDAFFVQVGTALRRGKWPWQNLSLTLKFRR
ncbi:MAG: P-loop NTPase fold protein [Opitutaceae bacterium]|nr:P-loop NTPase fold protein [Opitutaceae bacterium]